MDKHKRAVYLTFDDGPTPESTPFILDVLDKYEVKATFFMVGENVLRYHDLFNEVVKRGHRLGNHTFNHWGGFRHSAIKYNENVEMANTLIKTNLFRPPHGWMLWDEYFWLSRKYRIVMWDLVTRDYSKWMTWQGVFRNVKRYARNGSIITFHDSRKSIDKLQRALPMSLEWLKRQGYEFKTFDDEL